MRDANGERTKRESMVAYDQWSYMTITFRTLTWYGCVLLVFCVKEYELTALLFESSCKKKRLLARGPTDGGGWFHPRGGWFLASDNPWNNGMVASRSESLRIEEKNRILGIKKRIIVWFYFLIRAIHIKTDLIPPNAGFQYSITPVSHHSMAYVYGTANLLRRGRASGPQGLQSGGRTRFSILE